MAKDRSELCRVDIGPPLGCKCVVDAIVLLPVGLDEHLGGATRYWDQHGVELYSRCPPAVRTRQHDLPSAWRLTSAATSPSPAHLPAPGAPAESDQSARASELVFHSGIRVSASVRCGHASDRRERWQRVEVAEALRVPERDWGRAMPGRSPCCSLYSIQSADQRWDCFRYIPSLQDSQGNDQQCGRGAAPSEQASARPVRGAMPQRLSYLLPTDAGSPCLESREAPDDSRSG